MGTLKLLFTLFFILTLSNCASVGKSHIMNTFDEVDILNILDNSIHGDYNEFIDLNHGYFELADCRLLLFRNESDWMLVFEKVGYNARSSTGISRELGFFGSNFNGFDTFNNKKTNYKILEIENDFDSAILNKNKSVRLNGHQLNFTTNIEKYQELNIPLEADSVLYPGAILRFLVEQNEDKIFANITEVERYLESEMDLILVINDWYQERYSKYDPEVPPSESNFYPNLAKVIATGKVDSLVYNHKSNTHWSNWLESGSL